MRTNRVIRMLPVLLAASALLPTMGECSAGAEQPKFVNAKLETRSAAQNLENSVDQIAAEDQRPLWLAYGVAPVTGDHSVCCDHQGSPNQAEECGTCNLEQKSGGSMQRQSDSRTVQLEGHAQLLVLLRMDNRRLVRIRIASEDCTLDAGGLRVVWLTDVQPQESVALLTKQLGANRPEGEGKGGFGGQALMAIALHADPSADRAFASFVAPTQPAALRKQAAFWLGEARSKAGLALLQTMAKSDPDSEVRSQVSFGLSVSKEPAALDELIRMAREDSNTRVRSQALFWLAQKAGKKAEGAITGAIEDDPDTDVKKKAVFALSQMPKDEGIPKLIELAQRNKNPEVRKQAMFWLGQSGDSRVLAFFEKILSE